MTARRARPRARPPTIAVIVAIAIAIGVAWWQRRSSPAPASPPPTAEAAPPVEQPAPPASRPRPRPPAPPIEVAPPSPPPSPVSDLDLAWLTDRAERAAVAEVVAAIDRGGPFAYRKDGAVFENREGRLPSQRRGYWREYTVPTPGESDRGARRVVGGQRRELYYTRDHYRSFRRLRPPEP